MSSYTLELRHIHQTFKVFNFDYDFYTDSNIIKSKFEQKFIDEYYFHEIGQETVARFQHRLRTRLNKIMPYYKQLYDTELASKDINFLLNKDLRETFERSLTGENRNTLTANVNSISDLTHNENNITDNLESNIENGNASLDLDNGSLTNVSKNDVNTNSSTNNTVNDTTNQTVNDNITQSETTTLTSQGNIGITSSAELLDKWRSVLINIDQMIIDDCNDLFMQVY